MEFRIKSLPDKLFRVANISPIDLLAISSQIDFDNLKKTKELITFALENVEVNECGSWVNVKAKDREVYFPLGIEKNLIAMNEIFNYVTENVIIKAFQPSEE